MVELKVQAAAAVAGECMDDILTLFKPGARIALAVWFPGNPEADLVLLHPRAKIQDAIATLERRRDSEASVIGRTRG